MWMGHVVNFSCFETELNKNEMRTCRVKEIHLGALGRFLGFRFPYGWKELVANPRDLSFGIVVVSSLQILRGSFVFRLRW